MCVIIGSSNSKGDGSMKFIISGKNITVTEGLKTAVQDKLSKLERYFTPDTEVEPLVQTGTIISQSAGVPCCFIREENWDIMDIIISH